MIGHDLTIAGQGATTTIIDAEANTQPFAITGPNTSSTGIPITDQRDLPGLDDPECQRSPMARTIIGGAITRAE